MDYYYKYKKYKSKYLSQKGAAKTVDQQYEDKLILYTRRINNEIITLQLANDVTNFFEMSTTKSYDPENMHILEDKLLNRFISDIADKKIVDISVIQNIAAVIKKLVEKNYLKWYA